MRVINITKEIVFNFRYVGRPSIFGNPFHLERESDRDLVLLEFADYWYAPEQKWLRERALLEIHKGQVLGCYCHPKRCHADIIAGYIEWKNST